jgi:LUD domain
MDEFVDAQRKIIVDTTIESLEKHGFNALYCATGKEAADFIMKSAENCETVGIAGTHTVRNLEVIPMLQDAGKTIYDHWLLTPGAPDELECRRKQLTADLFLASTNALTMTGEIVNRDGAGNRVSAMNFGPKSVILVAGVNKIVPDLDAAMARLEEVAGPIRAMSLNKKTPCVKTGICMDCDSPERICRITSVIHRQPMFTKITVAILGEDTGY